MAKENCHRRVQEHPGDFALSSVTPVAAHLRPIGVFDSGVGGLSVLRALQAELPQEQFVYVADNGYAPYGERDDAHVLQRSHVIADFLVAHHGIKALVVACNTATAAAIHTLRHAYTELPIIGIEPALKPAAAASQTGRVGVMATRATLGSEKFARLLQSLQGTASFTLQACDGLADAIERSDGPKILDLCSQYTRAMGPFGNGPGEMDTLVLGCTHYPFVAETLQRLVGNQIAMHEGGIPVARQTRRLLEKSGLLRPVADVGPIARLEPHASPKPVVPEFYSTGNAALLDAAIQRWLHIHANTHALSGSGELTRPDA